MYDESAGQNVTTIRKILPELTRRGLSATAPPTLLVAAFDVFGAAAYAIAGPPVPQPGQFAGEYSHVVASRLMTRNKRTSATCRSRLAATDQCRVRRRSPWRTSLPRRG